MASNYKSWRLEYEELQRRLKSEIDELKAHHTKEELDKRFFINFGCINFCSVERGHEIALALIYHSMRMAENPSAHKITDSEPYSCYHLTKCTCGYSEACDSSD